MQYTLTLTKDASNNLSGTYTTIRESQEPSMQDIQNATLEGNKLTFDVERRFRDRIFATTHQGIVHADKIVGWSMSEFNGTPRDRSWTATRKRSPVGGIKTGCCRCRGFRVR